jgi:hypothetical protein
VEQQRAHYGKTHAYRSHLIAAPGGIGVTEHFQTHHKREGGDEV